MDKERQKVLMTRWTLLGLGAAVLLVAVRYLSGRSMPVVDQLPLAGGVILPLPFAIERLWPDLIALVAGPVFGIWLIGKTLGDPKSNYHGMLPYVRESKRIGLVVGCIAGIFCGVSMGWFFDNLLGVAAGFTFGLGGIAIMQAQYVEYSRINLDDETLFFTGGYSIGFGLTYGIVGYGLAHGLLFGLLYGLAVIVALFVASVIACLAFIWISAFISLLFETWPFESIGRWFLAEDDIEVPSSEDV